MNNIKNTTEVLIKIKKTIVNGEVTDLRLLSKYDKELTEEQSRGLAEILIQNADQLKQIKELLKAEV